jgi:hypothetical protein
METLGQAIVAVGWLGIAAFLLVMVVVGLRAQTVNCDRLPFFDMLERRGITLNQVEEAVGIDALARAVRRCSLCAGRSDCRPDVDICPNEALLRRAMNREHV